MQTYKEIQQELNTYRQSGYVINCPLNAKKEILLAEYQRILELPKNWLEQPTESNLDQLINQLEETNFNSPEKLLSDNTYVQDRVKALIPQLQELALFNRSTIRRDGWKNIKGWRSLAMQEVVNLKSQYPDDTYQSGKAKPLEERTYLTAWNKVYVIKNNLLAYINSDQLEDLSQRYSLRNLTNQLTNEMAHLLMEFKSKSNHTYQARVKERKKYQNRITIDLTKKLQLAHHILENVIKVKPYFSSLKKYEKPTWEDVSCAIALVTGRRATEIHQMGNFEYCSEYELYFSGQIKGKERLIDGKKLINHVFKIQTLIDSQYVIAGIEYLDMMQRRLSKLFPTVEVNARYSKQLSTNVKERWQINLNQEKSDITENENKEKQTYHTFRSFYFTAACQNYIQLYGFDLLDAANYAREIMGDDDLSVIESYQRFIIKPGTITQL